MNSILHASLYNCNLSEVNDSESTCIVLSAAASNIQLHCIVLSAEEWLEHKIKIVLVLYF